MELHAGIGDTPQDFLKPLTKETEETSVEVTKTEETSSPVSVRDLLEQITATQAKLNELTRKHYSILNDLHKRSLEAKLEELLKNYNTATKTVTSFSSGIAMAGAGAAGLAGYDSAANLAPVIQAFAPGTSNYGQTREEALRLVPQEKLQELKQLVNTIENFDNSTKQSLQSNLQAIKEILAQMHQTFAQAIQQQ